MVGLPLYWYHRERLIEARRWLSSAARLLPLDAAGAEPTEVTIFRIVRLATEIASGEQDGPRRDLDAVLAHARAVPASDLVDVGESLVAAGYAAWAVNAYDLALPIAAALAEVAGLSEDPRLVLQAAQVDCLAGLGGTRSDAEIAARSESLYERAVAADDLLVQWGAAGVRSVISHRLRDVSGVVWVDRLIPAHAHFGQGGGGSFIESLATFADALGDDETAVRMFAASEADLRRVGIPWPGFWGTSDRLARLRTTIAPSRFDELWREGASLTYEQIGLERGLLVGPHSPPDQQA
jgi:hypothetical protein